MNKVLAVTIFFFIFFIFSVFSVSVPILSGRVVDEANILTFSERNDIVGAVKKLEKNTENTNIYINNHSMSISI